MAIPGLRSREKLATYFRLPPKKLNEVLGHLLAAGLVVDEGGELRIGATTIRLGGDSPNIVRHYANWRQQAIESMDRVTETDLHYSGVLCLSKEAKIQIKDKILDALKEHLSISDMAKEEELCCYSIDLFDLRRP